MSTEDPRLHFYHRIADQECVQTRAGISKTKVFGLGWLRYRNVDTGPEALLDLKRLSAADRVPLLHDTLKLQIYSGKEAILRFLFELDVAN